jgi:hypothetical protein
MVGHSELSALARELFRRHLDEYAQRQGVGLGHKSVEGHTADEITAAYLELVRAGLMEPASPRGSWHGGPYNTYRLTEEAQREVRGF